MGDAGRVVAVLRDGAVATLDVEGIANRDTGEPLTVDSIFYVGSLAKQFVAACILLLADDGALDLHDPVRAFVPEAPGWGDRVTLAHLAHHTSGLPPPPYDQDGFSPTGVPAYGNLERLARVLAIEALDREPGVAYGYTNHGYTLLAEVVARTHGASLASFARDRLFGPLGMTDTWFRDAPTPLPERAARGHFDANDGTVRVEPAVFHAVGAGGLWTTVADLATWDRAFDDDTTIVPRLTERGTLRDGTTIHYAWGLSVRSHRGLPIVSHGGNFPGWESKMVRFPSERTTVIVLANREDLDVSALALRTADVVLADAMDRSAPHADATFDGTG